MRLLVFSQVDDWDFGPRLKASGHQIAAWVRPAWKKDTPYGRVHQALRGVIKAVLSQSKPIQMIAPKFDTWSWLDEQRIPRVSCSNVNDPQFVEYVRRLNIDLIAVCIFPQILKTSILQTPRLGVLNCHPSLLPRYGGPQPTFWMLKNGEPVAGVTVHLMTEKIDAGEIVVQQEFAIGEKENAGQLLQRQHHAAAALLTEAVTAIAGGAINPKSQNEAERSYFGKRKAIDIFLDWNAPARQITNLLRAVQPYEPLITHLNGWTIQIYHARPLEKCSQVAVPGQIIAKPWGRLLVQTGSGCLEIVSYEVKPFHGWMNRILQQFLLPVHGRFDVVPTTSALPSDVAS